MRHFAAEAGALNESGIAAIIVAISALIGAVFTALFQVIKYGGDRVDKSVGESLRTMAQSRDDAIDGEKRAIADRDRLIRERDDARTEMAGAYKERDRWMEMWQNEQARANVLEVRLAQKPSTPGPTGGDPG
jgi:hypothetical protein